jgi:hypothetical protein
VHDALEEKLSAIKCGSAVKQYQEMCVRHYDLVGKVKRTAEKLWITQEIISKMDE